MKNVMTIAWNIAKNAHSKFNTKDSIKQNGVISVTEFFAESLRLAWKYSKKGKQPKLHFISKSQSIIANILNDIKGMKINSEELYKIISSQTQNPYYQPKKKKRLEIQHSLF